MQKILEPFGFSFGQLQDIATMLKQLRLNHISMVEFIKHVEEMKVVKTNISKINTEEFKQLTLKWEDRALKCPECSNTMSLFPVNTRPDNQTGDNSKSQWFCQKCWSTVYSTKTINEILKEIKL